MKGQQAMPRLCKRCVNNCDGRRGNRRKFEREFPRNPLTGNDLLNVMRCDVCRKCLTIGNSKITEKQIKRLQLEDYYRSIGKPDKEITERMIGKSFRKLVERRRREIIPYYRCGNYKPDYERYQDERLGWCDADFLPGPPT